MDLLLRKGIGGVDIFPFETGKGSSHDCALVCMVRHSREVKGLKRGGARYKNIEVSLLLFADDIVLVARDLQLMLSVVDEYSQLFRCKFRYSLSLTPPPPNKTLEMPRPFLPPSCPSYSRKS